MNEGRLPCRRYGKITEDAVTTYNRDEAGALVPAAVRCRER
jgi:hypothetical protein